MMSIIIILGIMFLLIAIIPFSQCFYANKKVNEKSERGYVFEQDLLDFDLDKFKIEYVANQNITLEQMKNRGSVRIAQGLVLNQSGFEIRKREEYSKELP